ncbi:hypothetical protein SK803_41435 [Lentzea sp. BCCO 10_0856]|uniref:Peptidase S8/S53 domain-containing protein n=1 Tax=Lentzea miocenica TaxID=3095431 RepID=A0ABU4TEU2_9PSEU|nr:hypothetical protein [Lentzea sp. BCCO 10_0856]MDX8036697.1 hypothetical protein [Lentzea sp. BCCO 10_0856]
MVGTGGSNAMLSTWQRSGSDWTPVISGVAAKVGSPGISGSYGESSSATPAGVFAITGAFGRQTDPGAGVSYFRIDNSDWWVSDVNSPDCNTLCVPKCTSVQVAGLGAWLAVVGHDRAPCWSASLTLPSPTPSPRCGYCH